MQHFRVWDKKNNCWAREPIRIDEDGHTFYHEVHSFSYSAPWYLSDDYEVEFNTGITLADRTETFYGDIIRYDDSNYHGQKDRDGYVYLVIRQSNLFDLTENWLCEGNVWHDDIELVGNIHETELTDAMKVWIKG